MTNVNLSKYVPPELEKLLPQASPTWKVQVYRFWFKQLWYWIIRRRNKDGYPAPRPTGYFSSRGANFTTHYFGPFSLTYKCRWLRMSALALYPIIVKEYYNRREYNKNDI